MTTHKERIRAAVRGEMPDPLSYVPRIDLWYNANILAGTLPDKHKDLSRDEIARAEGLGPVQDAAGHGTFRYSFHRWDGLYSGDFRRSDQITTDNLAFSSILKSLKCMPIYFSIC